MDKTPCVVTLIVRGCCLFSSSHPKSKTYGTTFQNVRSDGGWLVWGDLVSWKKYKYAHQTYFYYYVSLLEELVLALVQGGKR